MEPNPTQCPNPKCKATLKNVKTVYNNCPSCKQPFFKFCHEFPWKLFQRVPCRKCPACLYYLFCKGCSSILVYDANNYRMGGVCLCRSCGVSACYLVCPKCRKAEVFPAEYRYEGVNLQCGYCSQKYTFVSCDSCNVQNYGAKNQNTIGKNFKCCNQKCQVRLTVKSCRFCRAGFADSKNNQACLDCAIKNYPPNPYALQKPKEPSYDKGGTQGKYAVKEPDPQYPTINQDAKNEANVDSDKQLCKICFDNEADHIHTSCFHLVVCGNCVSGMKGLCPMCRASGQFKKVFR